MVVSVLIVTFYIINQIFLISLHLTGQVFRIFRITSYLTEVLEQQRGRTPALNVMAIRDQCHANVSKQSTLLTDVDDAPPQGAVKIT